MSRKRGCDKEMIEEPLQRNLMAHYQTEITSLRSSFKHDDAFLRKSVTNENVKRIITRPVNYRTKILKPPTLW